MLVDSVGEITITNDGATILKNLEVQHPAAKVLVELSNLQDQEVGDGTTSVIIIAAELLKRANELVKSKLHPTTVISGYKMALKLALNYIKDNLTIKLESLEKDAIFQAAKTSMNSKLIGPESEKFARMVVDAMERVKVVGADKKDKYPLKSVYVVKLHGQSLSESTLVNGIILDASRACQGMPSQLRNVKIACLDMSISRYKAQLGVQVMLSNSDELEKVRMMEMDITKLRCKRVIDSGAKLILISKTIDDFAMKYFVEAGCILMRRIDRDKLKRIAKACGAKIINDLTGVEGEEKFDPKWLGEAEYVHEEHVSDWDYVFIEGMKSSRVQTLLIRGANDYMVDEVERSVHDALCIVKRVLESKTLVAGGGAVETALSLYLEEQSCKIPKREQIAILEFAEALMVIPKTLATNAALDVAELIANLRKFHSESQKDPSKSEYKYAGLDLLNGKVTNNLKRGVLEPAISKVKSLKFATEAAIAILRIDDSIKLMPKVDPKEAR
jgi:T-complex protein 1 subunit alpha